MQIIKDKQIVENTYRYLADDENLSNGNITVSLARWLQEKAQLLSHDGQVGLRLTIEDDVALIVDDLNKIALLELNFPAFTDGRLFSRAKLLRIRFGYQGEIRAVGNFMLDQVFYLSKIGVNAFHLNNEEQLPVALATLDDFSISYQ
jgi:uncharacterized protein (DUF934 family)